MFCDIPSFHMGKDWNGVIPYTLYPCFLLHGLTAKIRVFPNQVFSTTSFTQFSNRQVIAQSKQATVLKNYRCAFVWKYRHKFPCSQKVKCIEYYVHWDVQSISFHYSHRGFFFWTLGSCSFLIGCFYYCLNLEHVICIITLYGKNSFKH